MVAYPFRALVVLYRMLAILTYYRMANVWDIVATYTRLPMIFLSTDFLFEKRIGLVAMGSIIRFTH